MVIVAGHLIVAIEARDDYLAGCTEAVEQARRAPGCLERWQSQESVEAFRGSGPSTDQAAAIESASVSEYDVSGERSLT